MSQATLERNFIKIVKQRIEEYQLVKAGKHPKFHFVQDFYKHHKLTRQNFIKYYNRYQMNPTDTSLLPQKRGRKYGTLKTYPYLQQKILELRNQGFGKYDIYDHMLPTYEKLTPSITTIYNILKKYGVNKPSLLQQTHKRRYVKEKLGELGHIDCHKLQRGTVVGSFQDLYLLTLVDDCSRLAWGVVIPNLQALTVTIETLKLLSLFKQTYDITFSTIMSDNGSEFKGRGEEPLSHPFEYLLHDRNIRHIYTPPYQPQPNGKVERYWRSIEEEILGAALYPTQGDLEEELLQYTVYYNHVRKHHGIERQTPYQRSLQVINLSP